MEAVDGLQNSGGLGHLSTLNIYVKITSEDIDSPKRGGVMLCSCVTLVLARLWCDFRVSAQQEHSGSSFL